jgi:F0F1-type ATP synthase assembly protein I
MADDKNGFDWGRGLSSGLEVAVGVGVGWLIGSWVDRHLHSSPWGLIIGIMLGCAAGMYLLVKDLNRGN